MREVIAAPAFAGSCSPVATFASIRSVNLHGFCQIGQVGVPNWNIKTVQKCTNHYLTSCVKMHTMELFHPPQEWLQYSSMLRWAEREVHMSTSMFSLATYRPANISDTTWEQIAAFVRQCVKQVATPAWSSEKVRKTARVVAYLTEFVVTELGRDAHVETVFTERNVEACINQRYHHLSTHVQGSYRGLMRSVGRELNDWWDGKSDQPA